MNRIIIKLMPNKDANALFETLKQVGVTDARLDGYVVIGECQSNMPNLLRNIDGVISVEDYKEPSKPTPKPIHSSPTQTQTPLRRN